MIKNNEAAEIISKLSIEISQKLNKSIIEVKHLCEEEEYASYKLAVGKVLAEILLEIMNPIYSEKPNLKPNNFD